MEASDIDVDANGKGRVLYRELNWALRNDHPSLYAWASYMSALYFGGEQEYSASKCPVECLPKTSQTTYRGFSMDSALISRYHKGAEFFWQTFVSTSKFKEKSLDFARDSRAKGQASFLFVIEVREAIQPL